MIVGVRLKVGYKPIIFRPLGKPSSQKGLEFERRVRVLGVAVAHIREHVPIAPDTLSADLK